MSVGDPKNKQNLKVFPIKSKIYCYKALLALILGNRKQPNLRRFKAKVLIMMTGQTSTSGLPIRHLSPLKMQAARIQLT